MSRKRCRIWIGVIVLVILLVTVTYFGYKPSTNAPSWNGVTPGETSISQVRALLGAPASVELCPYHPFVDRQRTTAQWKDCFSDQIVYVYEEEIQGLTWNREIVAGFGRVRYIVEDIVPWQMDPNTLTVDKLLSEYGIPDRMVWSRRDESLRGLVYCDEGIAVHATSPIAVAYRIYFVPSSPEECMTILPAEFANADPYQSESLFEYPLDIWDTDWSHEVIEKMN